VLLNSRPEGREEKLETQRARRYTPIARRKACFGLSIDVVLSRLVCTTRRELSLALYGRGLLSCPASIVQAVPYVRLSLAMVQYSSLSKAVVGAWDCPVAQAKVPRRSQSESSLCHVPAVEGSNRRHPRRRPRRRGQGDPVRYYKLSCRASLPTQFRLRRPVSGILRHSFFLQARQPIMPSRQAQIHGPEASFWCLHRT
jgi:hypothetical protein